MFKKIPCLVAILFLTACGGGGSSSEPTTNTSHEESSVGKYAENISYATTEIVKRAIASETSPISLRSSRTSGQNDEKIEMQRMGLESIRAVETETEIGDCGGLLTTSTTVTRPDNEEQIFPFSTKVTLDYQDYCTGENGNNIIFNGTFLYDLSYPSDSEYSFIYRYNISYQSNIPFYPSGIISENETCIKEKDKQAVCTSSSLYEDSNGEEYVFSEAEIEGSASSGYSVLGIISDENNNRYDVNVSNFTQCDNGNVQTGIIEIKLDDGKIIHISFPNCSECIITYQGRAEIFPQN
ncbi:MAG: hypothetical protein L3J70_01115 [Gammaproteobacteria bacterium]|nr:hypothetical protein [Gammaproteobacteria bacterium]